MKALLRLRLKTPPPSSALPRIYNIYDTRIHMPNVFQCLGSLPRIGQRQFHP